MRLEPRSGRLIICNVLYIPHQPLQRQIHTSRVNTTVRLLTVWKTELHYNPRQSERSEHCSGRSCRSIFSRMKGWVMLCTDCVTLIRRGDIVVVEVLLCDLIIRWEQQAAVKCARWLLNRLLLTVSAGAPPILAHQRLGSTGRLLECLSPPKHDVSVSGRMITLKWLCNICLCLVTCGPESVDSASV